MREFLVLLKKELKSIKKEKTILLAIAIQFFIASFSSVILIGVMSFYDPESIGQNTRVTLDVGIVGDWTSPLGAMLHERNLEVHFFLSEIEAAEDAFQSGEVDTILFIPEVTDGVADLKLILPEADTAKTLILMVLNEPLKEYENYLREMNGVHLNYTDVEGKPHTNYEFLYSVIIPILMLFPAFIAGSMAVDCISEEMENKTLDTLWAAPLSLNHVFGSKIVAAILTAIAQCVLWSILLRFNGFTIQNLGLVLLLSVMIAASVSVAAALVALYFKDRERAQFVYSISLLGIAGLSYFLDPSPLSLLTRLASGDQYIGVPEVLVFAMPLGLLVAAFLVISRRLVLARA